MRIGPVDASVAASACAARLQLSSAGSAGGAAPAAPPRAAAPAPAGSSASILDSGVPAGQALAMYALQQSGSQAEMAAQLIEASLVPTLRPS